MSDVFMDLKGHNAAIYPTAFGGLMCKYRNINGVICDHMWDRMISPEELILFLEIRMKNGQIWFERIHDFETLGAPRYHNMMFDNLRDLERVVNDKSRRYEMLLKFFEY